MGPWGVGVLHQLLTNNMLIYSTQKKKKHVDCVFCPCILASSHFDPLVSFISTLSFDSFYTWYDEINILFIFFLVQGLMSGRVL